ncbi:protein of unknown function [Lentzea xinjiangensis]|uniref:DUF397 domain-containing protein n=1 Tax=Lentzea xinjiangensis TaxID=402600 RepID=A0A1H9B8S4_9PSEU|nr:DUF397 domain-containing protein [Lentzea xinjiangensis]SEP84638.1 protein of unknown function [Lentzea xinjiangensis]
MIEDRIWRKSSYSNGTPEGECVEVSLTGEACVRDSKNVTGGMLTFSTAAWHAFLGEI